MPRKLNFSGDIFVARKSINDRKFIGDHQDGKTKQFFDVPFCIFMDFR